MDLVNNKITDDGMKVMRLVVPAASNVNPLIFVPAYLRNWASVTRTEADGMAAYDIIYPLLGPVDFQFPHGTKRYVVVHHTYGVSVRDCIRLALDCWKLADGEPVKDNAFVRKLPGGVVNGVEVANVQLFEAEWMLRGCVAVG